MQYIYWLMAFAVGAGAAIQAAINARLAHGLGEQPVVAAFLSFLVGTLCLGVVMLHQANLGLAMDWRCDRSGVRIFDRAACPEDRLGEHGVFDHHRSIGSGHGDRCFWLDPDASTPFDMA